MKYWSQPASSSLSNYEQDDVIPASPGVTTYHYQKTKVPKQTKLYPPLNLKKTFHKRRDKTCFLLGFDISFPGWECTVITCTLNLDISARACTPPPPPSL